MQDFGGEVAAVNEDRTLTMEPFEVPGLFLFLLMVEIGPWECGPNRRRG